MDADVFALRELARVLFWAGVWILALMAFYIARAIASPLDIHIPVIGRPFHGIHTAIERGLIEPLGDLRHDADKRMAQGFSGLVDSLAIWLGLVALAVLGIRAIFRYLWAHLLGPFVHAITDTIRDTAHQALVKVEAVPGQIEHAFARAERYADAAAADALHAAQRYALSVAHTAEHAAERYADEGIDRLRTAEDLAVEHATRIANEALAEIAKAEGEAVSAADLFTRGAVDAATKELEGLIGDVRGVAVGAEHELEALERAAGAAGLPALIASIPALQVLVQAITTEAGLGNAECRGKVKSICSTSPALWEQLLAGLLPLGLAFDLAALAEVARPLLGDLEHLIREAA